MKRKDVITITGDLASGQSTIAKMLADDLKYDLYRNGAYFRKLGMEKNMSVTEFGEYVKNHPEIDRQIEKSAAEYAKTHSNIVIDAKLGWYVVPDSFKIYLRVNIDVAAQRAFSDKNRKNTENLPTIEAQKEDLQKRFKNDLARYLDLYGVKRDDMTNYDFVLDTSDLTIEQVLNAIKQKYEEWKQTD